MAFLWKAIGLSDSIPGFPYTPSGGGGSTTAVTPTLTWTMRPGVGSEDGRAVTIFSISLLKADSGVKELARHAMRRAKSLLLPGLLRCYGAVEHQETVYIATEPCEPLRAVLLRSSAARIDEDGDEEEAFLEGVALGLKAVGTALTAMHRNNFVHGNVSSDSIFVVAGDEWRLFGLELVSVFNEPHSIYQRYGMLLPEGRRPPETLQTSYEASLHISDIDSWGLACLIYEVLGGAHGRTRSLLEVNWKANDMRGCRSLPRTLQSGFIGLCAANPKMRHDVGRFLNSSEFIVGSEFVQCMQALDELSLKDTVERERFFEHLTEVVDTFPKKACRCLVLPKLKASLKFGALPAVVEPVLKIASQITAAEHYAAYVAPIILTLFASQDRMVRYRLLQRASEYASRLPAAMVSEQLWPYFMSGFSSPVPSIREHSVRALVAFADNLSEKIMITEVPRFISQLQQDTEGAIRTNATISLCLMAEKLPAENRSHILVNGFGRMLKDPFVPSRLGALRSFHTCLVHLTPQHIAELMLPGVGPRAVDDVREVRQAALDVLREAIGRLDEYSAQAPSQEAKAVAAAEATDAADANKKPASSWWGWARGAAATATAVGDAKGEPVSEGGGGGGGGGPALAGGGWDNGVSKVPATPPLTSSAAATKIPTTRAPVTESGFSDDDAWGTNDDEVSFQAPPSEDSSVTGKSTSRHIDVHAVNELARGGRAMKLRKKGLGAARLQ
ncbi:SCY1 family protein kinase [Trypanosoma conorhini]|uniref:SCY1 family protein kinase n=1 Tax=Trypanosoma conorhini TaxID=83891 RepID=A0A422Q3E1_9TRYP|nr:SCY1 family protein kinase [Trypanosoma conorhini]RNF24486.1 SCY1 family protein kinase [Trypanosoma conorhini]